MSRYTSYENGLLKFLLGIFVATEDMPYSATDFVKQAKSSEKNWLIWILAGSFWLSLLTIIILSLIYFVNSKTLFNVSAVTEKIEVRSFKDVRFPSWLLNKAILHDGCDVEAVEVSGLLTINSTATIEFLRVGKGDLLITLYSDESKSVGKLEGNAGKLSDCVIIQLLLAGSRTFTMPIDGNIEIGGEVKEAVERVPVLLDGQIYIADKGILSQEYYVSSPQELSLGDKFSIQDQITQSSGFVLINDNPGMKVTFAGKGSVGVIERYKTENITLKNSFWTKLFNDETVVLLWVLLVALYTIIKVSIRFCIE